jgi:heme exporter protein A
MARVLALRAPLWLLDEPFTNLDGAGSDLITGLLAEHVSQGGLAVVVAHHDLPAAATTRRLELHG